MKKYQIFPRKHKDVAHIHKNSLECIAKLIELWLEEKLLYTIIDDGIEIMLDEKKMEELIKASRLNESCIIIEEDVEIQ